MGGRKGKYKIPSVDQQVEVQPPGGYDTFFPLTPNHILQCPTVATKLLKMGMVPLRDSLREILYSPDAPRIAEAVIKTFDGI
ncbi:hypothetical protein TNCV_1505991 [Trichonephila clavipes]|nr:hypothetical protein TNCV_1505991 [Trichonephila clavipes]